MGLGGIVSVIGELVGIGKTAGLIKTPEDEMKMRQQLLDYFSKQDTAYSDMMKSINETMQAEAKSEHWIVWAWRPVVGLTFVFVIVWNYILTPLLQTWTRLQSVTVPDQIWNAMLVILGAASATRGWQLAQEARAKALGYGNGNGNGGSKPSGAPDRPSIIERPDRGDRAQ